MAVTVQRTDVMFTSHGIDCAAWLYRPQRDGPSPLIVMAHGFSATRDQGLPAYAERYSAAGLAVLLFDYRHFGASAGLPRQLLDVRRQHADYHAAVGYARSLHWVDPERVALFGSSFSGGHVIAVAAQDPGIAAIVSQCPFTDGPASLRVLPPANAVRATGAGLADLLAAARHRGPRYIPAVGPPGTFAVMSTPDAEAGFRAITPSPTEWENRVAARIALAVGLYRPGRDAARLRCPALFCVCDGDSVAPAVTTLKHVARAPRGRVMRYPVGHFEIYVGDPFEQAVADQTDFLVEVLEP